MSIPYAFVTLLTSDAYLPGALTVAAALKDVHRDQTIEYETVCLVAPETVDVSSIRLLRKAFDVVIGVEAIVPPDTESLTLLGACSPIAFFTSRLHMWGRHFPGSPEHTPRVSARLLSLEHGSMQRCFLPSYNSLEFPATFFSSDAAPLARTPGPRHGPDKVARIPPHAILQGDISGCRRPSSPPSITPLPPRS